MLAMSKYNIKKAPIHSQTGSPQELTLTGGFRQPLKITNREAICCRFSAA